MTSLGSQTSVKSYIWFGACCDLGEKLLATFNFNSYKSKLLLLHPPGQDSHLALVQKDGTFLNEALCPEKLKGLQFIPDLNLNSYIQTIAKDVKMFGPFFLTRKFLGHAAMLFMRAKFAQRWNIVASSGLSLSLLSRWSLELFVTAHWSCSNSYILYAIDTTCHLSCYPNL